MPTPYFRHIVKQLESKNTKDELAKMLIKHKDKKHVSKAITAAYNRKVMSEWNYSNKNKKQESVYDLNKRVIGPASWFYKVMSTEPWNTYISDK